MSDDAVKSHTISTADVQRFMSAKRITGCAVCSHYDWRIKSDTTSLQCNELSADAARCSAQVDVIMLVCQNCGALEFHDQQVIARWLACHAARL